jgi:TolA-binding protein
VAPPAVAAPPLPLTPAAAAPERVAPPPAPVETAGSLLADANRSRRAGEAERAIAFYRYLQTRFPRSPEAVVSLVSLGQLLVERQAPAEALRAFDTYLGGHAAGPLAEEALDGKARALAALGRTEEERAVLRTLLARHPASAYAPRARQRLGVTTP